MLGPANEVTIVVEPTTREEDRSRQEEVRTATKNDGAGLREWFVEEAAWLTAQFVKIATSVAVVRWVHQLFRVGLASETAYERAPRLWSDGDRPEDQKFGASESTRGHTTWKPRSEDTPGPGRQSASSDHGADRDDANGPRYVVTVEGFHLYLHRKLLSPDRQFWPCPLLYVSPCESCALLEYDRAGRPRCVPLVKLKMVLAGTDAGEDLSEIRQWIRSSY
jgi:hypothetical protein